MASAGGAERGLPEGVGLDERSAWGRPPGTGRGRPRPFVVFIEKRSDVRAGGAVLGGGQRELLASGRFVSAGVPSGDGAGSGVRVRGGDLAFTASFGVVVGPRSHALGEMAMVDGVVFIVVVPAPACGVGNGSSDSGGDVVGSGIPCERGLPKGGVVEERSLMNSGRGNGLLRAGSEGSAKTNGVVRVSELDPRACDGRAPLKQVLGSCLPVLAEGAGIGRVRGNGDRSAVLVG